MKRWMRRSIVAGGVLGVTASGMAVRRRRQRRPIEGISAAVWPPLTIADAGDESAIAPADVEQARWRAPVDGQCPDGYAVKASGASQIFHLPGGRFYDRTVPERCYADAEHAEADGYRPSKA